MDLGAADVRRPGKGGAMGHPGVAAPTIRLLRGSDIEFALVQTARERWDCTAATFALHLGHDRDGCFIAEVDGRPAGMVTTTRYRQTGWIGNLIVTPERRGLGIGSQLMAHALKHLERDGTATIRLEADPLGVNIYRRLGFEDEFESPRFRREPGVTTRPASVVWPGATDFDDLKAFDEPHFGDDRRRLLSLLLEGALAAFRMPEEGRPSGYLIVQPSANGARIGPWVASNTQAAGDLLENALAAFGDRTVILAVPGPNAACRELLASRGFIETPSSLRMVRGPKAGPGKPENIYALATGAVG
jgi:ribosomal protein S18 acetylase RimI-like enzyme